MRSSYIYDSLKFNTFLRTSVNQSIFLVLVLNVALHNNRRAKRRPIVVWFWSIFTHLIAHYLIYYARQLWHFILSDVVHECYSFRQMSHKYGNCLLACVCVENYQELDKRCEKNPEGSFTHCRQRQRQRWVYPSNKWSVHMAVFNFISTLQINKLPLSKYTLCSGRAKTFVGGLWNYLSS